MTELITPREFEDAAGTEDWRVLADGAHAFFRAASIAAGARLAQAIAELPGSRPGRPDIDLRADGVTTRLITATDDAYGMTADDVDLASRISVAARELRCPPDPSVLQTIMPIVIDALDIPGVMPFWQALLGYVRRLDSPDEDLVDPRSRAPAFWFEHMAQPRPDGGGAIHVAIWVPFEQAAARIAAALAAGGRMVRDEFAPAWWTLADTAGNEADIATTMGRD